MNLDADIVVVGSGVAGALTAWALARNGAKVIVLEAGPRIVRTDVIKTIKTSARRDHTAGYPDTRWAPRPNSKDNGAVPYIRGTGGGPVNFDYLRVVGGTTWLWSGGADRMLPSDLETRSRYGVGQDWPFDYDEIEPFFRDAEQQLGVAGNNADVAHAAFPLPPVPPTYLDEMIAERLRPQGFASAIRPAARNSQTFDGRPQCAGYGTCTPLCPIGAQYSANVHLQKAEELGARVYDNCRVDGFEADDTGRISAVRFGRPDGTTGVATARQFVLAANAIESPRLLLASANAAYPQGLANSSGQVGRNFMAHTGYATRFETPFPLYGNRGPRVTSYFPQFRDGDFRRERAAFMITINNHIDLLSITAELLDEGVMPPKIDGAIMARAIRTATFEVFAEHLPSPDNRITIDMQDRDSAGQPRIIVSLSPDAYQERGLAESKRVIAGMTNALQATRIKFGDHFNAHHLMGTLRMGDDPRTSVTDATGRCHDHPNLFVAGSSLFPSFGAASPTLTIAALALRTAKAIDQFR